MNKNVNNNISHFQPLVMDEFSRMESSAFDLCGIYFLNYISKYFIPIQSCCR